VERDRKFQEAVENRGAYEAESENWARGLRSDESDELDGVSTLTGCVFQDEDRLPGRGRTNPNGARARHSRSGRIGPGTDPL